MKINSKDLKMAVVPQSSIEDKMPVVFYNK